MKPKRKQSATMQLDNLIAQLTPAKKCKLSAMCRKWQREYWLAAAAIGIYPKSAMSTHRSISPKEWSL